jgi:glycosyltransferase involved in cell wall biosynthesis
MTHSFRVAHVTSADIVVRFNLLSQLKALRDHGFEVSAICAPGPFVEAIEAEGIRHIPWAHSTRTWDLASDLRAFRELLGILRRERFDLLHTHNPKPGVLGRVAGRLMGLRVVNTVHGLYARSEDPLLRRLPVMGVESVAARLSDLELFQSREDLEWMSRARAVRPARSALLGNGVNLSSFAPSAVPPGRPAALRAELGIPPETPVVATVARLVAEKGYRELFAAAGALRSNGDRPRFLAIGGAEPMKRDRITTQEMEAVSSDVTFLGWRHDVRDLLSVADVFVLPSWREGLPRAAIEAAAMAKPMVLTDIRGCREVARNGVEGLLVPPRDPHALTGAIARLLNDPELGRGLGGAARARAVERFDERQVIDTVLERYRGLLATRD